MSFIKQYQKAISLFDEYNGIERYCNICGYNFKKYKNFGSQPREALCPVCGSLERHRHLFVYILSIFPFLKKSNVLLISPEVFIKGLICSYCTNYKIIDVFKSNYNQWPDILSENFINNIDYVFCIHVLQNVKNDLQLIEFLYNALNQNGTLFISVPLANEFEEIKCISESNKTQQARKYTLEELVERLQNAKFNCDKVSYPHKLFSTYKRCKLGDIIILAKK